MQNKQKIARVALPLPLHRLFDFILRETEKPPRVGSRVRVPFGKRRMIGVVAEISDSSDIPAQRLREITEIVDDEPVFSVALFDWLKRIARYYQCPLGEVINTAFPKALRQGLPLVAETALNYRLTRSGINADPDFRRAPLQRKIWLAMQQRDEVSPLQLNELGRSWRRALEVLMERGWIEACSASTQPSLCKASVVALNSEQSHAAQTVIRALGTYSSFVLFGVTGSGKTEVYLEVIREVIARGKQVLILVPEIGLTPQLVRRFQTAVGRELVVQHSEIASGQRHRNWAAARQGDAAIVLGTRSAVFTPLAKPGLIVVDEEHDLSYKQQDGFRYHARDIAVLRARHEQIPIVLGSATPSFESVSNADKNRYTMLKLTSRALGAALPRIDLVDMRQVPVEQGLSRPLIEAIDRNLQTGEQCLIFVNRRGYAPVLFCPNCGWQAQCDRCDTKMVYHKSQDTLRCHHCGQERHSNKQCPECGIDRIRPLGAGTQRLEEHLSTVFPDASIVRLDRDSISRKGELERRLEQGSSGKADILIGTQLLAKGHHFPKVTLVGVVDVDQGLYSVDFRAAEYLFQQIVQVAGRAGRAQDPGRVLIQTVYPEHPLFNLLREHNYRKFVDIAMEERHQAQAPPLSRFTLLRAESTKSGLALAFLQQARRQAQTLERFHQFGVCIMEPVPSPLEKRAGRFRAQLLLWGYNRGGMQSLLSRLVDKLEAIPLAKRVRWSIDVDPMEMY